MPSLTTDMITEVLEGGSSIPEIAKKLEITLSDFLDWFFTKPVQEYIAMYRAANRLIAEARASVHAAALIDRLRQQMGHPDPGLSIRASNTLARFVLREMPHHSRKSTPESEHVRRQPLPEQPGYLAGIERDEKARAKHANTEQQGTKFCSQPSAPESIQCDAPSQDSRVHAPDSRLTVTPQCHHALPAQSHPAPRDATPPLPSSSPPRDRPTPPQTPLQSREPIPLPDQWHHAQAGRTTPPPEACAA